MAKNTVSKTSSSKKVSSPHKISGNGLPANGKTSIKTRLNILKTYKIYIGGKFPRTESGRYYKIKDQEGVQLANVCRSSRKDFRNAVVAARKAFPGWSGKSAFNRGQIIYRIAEILEGRSSQFEHEIIQQGTTPRQAKKELALSIDRLIYYAGWADKYQQIFSCVNPVSSSHFNFSLCESTGVVAVIAPEDQSLLGLISTFVPVITGGNTCVVLASGTKPLCSITLAEVLNSSDVPGGVVNILTGYESELHSWFSSHMDVNAILYGNREPKIIKSIQENATKNLKRVVNYGTTDWEKEESQNPYRILDFQEIKTTWHPIGI